MSSNPSEESPKPQAAFNKHAQLMNLIHVLKHTLGMSQSAAGTLANEWRVASDNLKNDIAKWSILRAINYHVDKYKARSFANFSLEVNVYPVTGSPALRLPIAEFEGGSLQIGYKLYIFQVGDTRKVIRVRHQHGTVLVAFCGRFRPISTFLNEFHSIAEAIECIEGVQVTEVPFDSKRAYQTQFDWWLANGKTFRIQDLPGELRNIIYGHVFGSSALPYPKHKCRFNSPTPRANTALMSVSKKLHSEASHIFYKDTTLRLEHGILTKKLLSNKHLRPKLSNLTLALTHSNFFDLFHFDVDTDAPEPDYALRPFREINLSRLVFHLAAPSRVADREYIEGACQKAVVERIFEAAFPSIKGHPVIITGCIKDSQKAIISSRLDAAHQAFTKWSALKSVDEGDAAPKLSEYDAFMRNLANEPTGGVSLDDGEARIEDVDANAEASFITSPSLVCLCEVKCRRKGWTNRC